MNKERADRNEVTKLFSKIRKNVDKFHFGNHIDQWCIDNCDPYKVPELNNVNTVICEQLFRKVNSHVNCKSMNESRYFLFWLYNLDLHNLDIEGMAGCTPDPRSDYRWKNIQIIQVNLDDIEKMDIPETDEEFEKVIKGIKNINVEELKYMCNICNAGYKSEGYLFKHMKDKHEQENLYNCSECGKNLSSKRNFENHILTIHRTCKNCKPNKVFESTELLKQHMKSHLICNICNTTCTTKYNLERHMKTHL